MASELTSRYDEDYFRDTYGVEGLTSVLACLSAAAILPPHWGENVMIIARKPAGAVEST